MKTPESGTDTNVLSKNDSSFILREAAALAMAGYSEHLSAGGKGDPAEESWIDALFDGADAIVEMDNLKSRLAQVEKERDVAVRAISIAQHYIKDLGAVQYGLQQLENWDYELKRRGVCPENTKEEPK